MSIENSKRTTKSVLQYMSALLLYIGNFEEKHNISIFFPPFMIYKDSLFCTLDIICNC